MFVAFLHEAYWKIGPKRREELEALGFVMPEESFVRSWSAKAPWGAAQAKGTASVRVASEPVYKDAHTSYKAHDKRSKQEEMFPKLQAEIEKKREARYSGKQYTAEDRFGLEFRGELAEIAMDKIGVGNSRGTGQVLRFKCSSVP